LEVVSVNELGRVVAVQVQRITIASAEPWERVLRLHIKPKPDGMPGWLWAWMVRQVFVQSEQKREVTI
jgi:hypothetical protein